MELVVELEEVVGGFGVAAPATTGVVVVVVVGVEVPAGIAVVTRLAICWAMFTELSVPVATWFPVVLAGAVEAKEEPAGMVIAVAVWPVAACVVEVVVAAATDDCTVGVAVSVVVVVGAAVVVAVVATGFAVTGVFDGTAVVGVAVGAVTGVAVVAVVATGVATGVAVVVVVATGVAVAVVVAVAVLVGVAVGVAAKLLPATVPRVVVATSGRVGTLLAVEVELVEVELELDDPLLPSNRA